MNVLSVTEFDTCWSSNVTSYEVVHKYWAFLMLSFHKYCQYTRSMQKQKSHIYYFHKVNTTITLEPSIYIILPCKCRSIREHLGNIDCVVIVS